MRFEWDEAKNDANRRKHGLSFETACRVFEDPLILSKPERIVDSEQRWQTIGEIAGVALVLVAHAVREGQNDEVIRIISARRATRHERKKYQQA